MIILWSISKSNASNEVTLNRSKNHFDLVTNIIKYLFNDITPWRKFLWNPTEILCIIYVSFVISKSQWFSSLLHLIRWKI